MAKAPPTTKPTPKPKAKAAAVAPGAITYYTPAQQRAQALAEARAAQLPGLQAITAARTQSRSDFEAAQAALERDRQQSATDASNAQTTNTGYYTALAKLMGGSGDAVQAAYNTAGDETGAFAKGFAHGQSIVQGQAGDQAANIVGSAGGNADAARAVATDPGAAVTLGIRNGLLPAQGLFAQGANAVAEAKTQLGAVGEQGAASLADLQSKQALADRGFSNQSSDMLAKFQTNLTALAQQGINLKAQFPGVYQAALRSIAANETSKHAAEASAAYLAARTGAVAPTTAKVEAQTYQAWNPVTKKWQLVPVRTIINAKGQVVSPVTPAKPPYSATPAGQAAAAKKAQAAAAVRQKAQYDKYRQSAYDDATTFHNSKGIPHTALVGLNQHPVTTYTPYTYQYVYQALYNRYGLPLMRMNPKDPKWVANVVAMIKSATTSAGYQPPPPPAPAPTPTKGSHGGAP